MVEDERWITRQGRKVPGQGSWEEERMVGPEMAERVSEGGGGVVVK